jgi:hypothetical protein
MSNPYLKDKFERWLIRFRPELLCEYERGYDRGNIEIHLVDCEQFRAYHLYHEGKLLGTLLE